MSRMDGARSIKTVSVISKMSRDESTPVSCRTLATVSSKSGAASWRAERFTVIEGAVPSGVDGDQVLA
jgi:hypothetical protein